MTVKAYQTLEDRGNIDYLENNGPFKCTRSNAWLGFGYYFWDTKIEWAYNWGKNSYKNIGKDYVIGECQLELDETCFDLFGSVEHQSSFTEVIELLKTHPNTKGANNLNVPNVITYMKSKGIFDYKSIRASDMSYMNNVKIYFTKKKKEYTILNPRVQVCVINLNGVFINPFKIVFPN